MFPQIYRNLLVMCLKIITISLILFCHITCKNSTQSDGNNQQNDPNLNTDKQKIVFVSDRDSKNKYFQIYIMDVDGTNERPLTHDENNYYFPQFSPDGTKILFFSQHKDNDDIFIIDVDGNNFKKLTDSPGNDNLPQFSPDGSKIVFTSDRDGNREIYIMEANGSFLTRLTNNDYCDHSPQFSPDGKKILYYESIDIPYSADSYDICLMDIDGSNKTRLTPENLFYIDSTYKLDDTPNLRDAAPSFSPDGLKIIFMAYMNRNFELYLMDSDGKNISQLVNQAGGNFAPVFHPDGSRILFRSHRDGDFDLYYIYMDQEFQKRVTDDTGHTYFGDFSQDGSMILYFSNIDENFHEFYHIYIANADGSQRKKLTAGDYVDYFPSFQPH